MDGIGGLMRECIEPGLWEVEGVQVRRSQTRRGKWIVVWEPGVRSGVYDSFKEALGAIVDAINNDAPPFGDKPKAARCGTCYPPAEDTPEREAMDRFQTFLRIIDDAPRDEEGRYLINARAVAYAKGEDVDPMGCTGLTASWCPRHGDCTCPRHTDGAIEGEVIGGAMDDPSCPLHAPSGDHPWPEEAEER